MTSRAVASVLIGVLLAVAGIVAWTAGTWVHHNAATLINPGRAYGFVITVGVVAAGFCITALWYLRRVWQGCGGWLAVLISYPLALIALVGLLVAAGITGLGG